MTFPETAKFNSVDVAKYIVGKAIEKGIVVNITKVQKLLYIAYGIYLRVYNERLTNEHPQAWPYGPVFPTTRNRLVKENLMTITTASCPQELQDDARLNKVVDFTLAHFGSWTAGQLTEWSHRDGSPWYYATQTQNFEWGDQIPDASIYNYFKTLITIKGEEEDGKK